MILYADHLNEMHSSTNELCRRYFSTYVIANLGIDDKRTTIMINIFLLLWKACCSVGGIFLIDKIGARKPLSKYHGADQ